MRRNPGEGAVRPITRVAVFRAVKFHTRPGKPVFTTQRIVAQRSPGPPNNRREHGGTRCRDTANLIHQRSR
ncbi:MAG TPA: hypothetical protein DEP05_04380 [Betaproteobacteria bacterium]|nr:hypothetical protein [Betaproteobacteria bacterium]